MISSNARPIAFELCLSSGFNTVVFCSEISLARFATAITSLYLEEVFPSNWSIAG